MPRIQTQPIHNFASGDSNKIELKTFSERSIFVHLITFRMKTALFENKFKKIFGLKNSNFQLPYQHPSSSADCARELFNGSNGSAILVDCTRKKIFWLGGAGFL